MSDKTNMIEVSGAKVEEAVSKGLAQLGLGRGDVVIEVLDEGSSGFLGLGGRDAVVRLTLKAQPTPVVKAEIGPPVPAVPERVRAEEQPAPLAVDDHDIPEEEVAQNIVEILLQKMRVEATVSLDQTEPDDLTGEQRWVVDIRGTDLGMLIGPRGETLNALQYISRLMTGHVIQQRPSYLVDVEGYRGRREQALARLAARMADKALKRGRPVTLEPMPANERRIIHVSLRDNERVETQSTGEGSRRRVQIMPK